MELMDSTRPGSSIGLGDAWHGPSVAEARQFVRGLLEHWHFDPVTTADTILVTSELVTNAFVHAAGPVRLDVARVVQAVHAARHEAEGGEGKRRVQQHVVGEHVARRERRGEHEDVLGPLTCAN